MKQISIKNFQSHKDTNIELCNGVNVFTGNSDCGKSAIMRAIIWACTNGMRGDYYVSNWCRDKKGSVKGECNVSIDSVSRIRSSSDNCYVVAGNKKFEALRNDVPDEVSRALNIGEVNIQRQLDPPFMLSNTPGENARYVNELVNLTDIDTALAWVSSQKRECGVKIKAYEYEAGEIRVIAQESIRDAKSMSIQLELLEDKISKLEDKIEKVNNSIAEYGRFSKIHLEPRDAELSRVAYMLQKGFEIRAIVDRLERSIAGYRDAEQVRAAPQLDVRRIERLGRLITELQSDTDMVGKSIKEWGTLTSKQKELEGVIAESLEALSHLACPCCGNIGYHK